MNLFAPKLPAEILREERERVSKKRSRLWLVKSEPRPESPNPEMFRWWSIEELLP